MDPSPLRVEVVEVRGECPLYQPGDFFYIHQGYRLAGGSREGFCLHALSVLLPYYVALSRGVKASELNLNHQGGEESYLQCPDPCDYTGGGTVILRVERESSGG